MKFDVVDDSCVSVIYIGKTEIVDVSIHKLFEEAHLISSVYTNSAMEEYGIKRTLVAFFMDAFRPKDNAELKSLLFKGYFDISVIDDYVSKCRMLGDVFNLFDEKFPFLQLKNSDVTKYKGNDWKNFYSLWWDSKNVLDTDFEKYIESKDIFRALCAYNVFLPSMIGRGYPPNLNGLAPWYFWIKGKNLFEELIYNSISEEEWDRRINKATSVNFPYAEDEVHFGTHWTTNKTLLTNKSLTEEYKKCCNKSSIGYSNKNVGTVTIKDRIVHLNEKNEIEGYATISLLEGLTYQGKGFLVKPIVDSGNNVLAYKLHYEIVYKFSNLLKQWRDPFCIYVETTDKTTKEVYMNALKPNKDTFLWSELYTYLYEAASDRERPMILDKFGGFSLLDLNLKHELKAWGINGDLELIVYGSKSDKGKYLWFKRELLTINATLFELNKQKWYRKAIAGIGSIADIYMQSNFVKICNVNFTNFYSNAQSVLEGSFVHDLINATNEDEVLDNFLRDRLNFIDKLFTGSFNVLDINKRFKNKGDKMVSSYSRFYSEKARLRSAVKKELKL